MKSVLNLLREPIQKYLDQNENLIAPAATHSLLCINQDSPILVVTTSTRAANELAQELISLEGEDQVINFPA
ncbi:MAG: hypothetical protein EBY90_02380, partial [Actinobacteria bacterium]|nr:hypothetical protein [Actinomycetota bacterium]